MTNNHPLHVDTRPSDSPWVESVWRSHSNDPGTFCSIATSRWEMIVSQHDGKVYFSVRGPETHPSLAHCPPDGNWIGIQFKHGVFMPHLPVSELVDGGVALPKARSRAFWLHGAAWEMPTFDNADTFVARLIQEEVLVCDPVVQSALLAQATDLSPRSVQRRFLRATGLTQGAVDQIERAHAAVALLRQGVSILDTVERTGYADQPHMTRLLKRLIGQTPAQLIPDSDGMQLSFSPVIASAK